MTTTATNQKAQRTFGKSALSRFASLGFDITGFQAAPAFEGDTTNSGFSVKVLNRKTGTSMVVYANFVDTMVATNGQPFNLDF